MFVSWETNGILGEKLSICNAETSKLRDKFPLRVLYRVTPGKMYEFILSNDFRLSRGIILFFFLKKTRR